MRLPVPNLGSAIVDRVGKIIPPWNSWFQQFSQNAPTGVPLLSEPSYRSASIGNIILTFGNPTITLIRGSDSIDMTGQKTIPVSIGDVVNFSGTYSALFMGD